MKRLLFICLLLSLAGCNHKPKQVKVPPAPPPQEQAPEGTPPAEAEQTKPPAFSIPPQVEVSPETKPLLVETGIANWYGAPYHNRRGSNGEIYDMHAMTAAHRTLPLGSIVRVTCLSNGNTAIVRITDRGPFIEGRIIDLSRAAAEQLDMIRKGTGEVRV